MGTVAIVDYGVGNLKSVANALSYLGCSSCITASFTRPAHPAAG